MLCDQFGIFLFLRNLKYVDSMLIMLKGEENVKSLVEKITTIRGKNIPFFRPKRTLLTTEASLVFSKTFLSFFKPFCII